MPFTFACCFLGGGEGALDSEARETESVDDFGDNFTFSLFAISDCFESCFSNAFFGFGTLFFLSIPLELFVSKEVSDLFNLFFFLFFFPVCADESGTEKLRSVVLMPFG